MTMVSKKSVLDAAIETVAGRGVNYGTPENNFSRIAIRWHAHFQNRYGLAIPIDAKDVAMMMVDMKLARLENNTDHLDSWIDIAGYAACGANLGCVEDNKVLDDFNAAVRAQRVIYPTRKEDIPNGLVPGRVFVSDAR